jgi:hypothetical protein
LKKPFKELESRKSDQFMGLLLANMKAALCLPVGVKCPSFDWASSWNSSCEGRPTLAYLLKNPGESHNIHLVM